MTRIHDSFSVLLPQIRGFNEQSTSRMHRFDTVLSQQVEERFISNFGSKRKGFLERGLDREEAKGFYSNYSNTYQNLSRYLGSKSLLTLFWLGGTNLPP